MNERYVKNCFEMFTVEWLKSPDNSFSCPSSNRYGVRMMLLSLRCV